MSILGPNGQRIPTSNTAAVSTNADLAAAMKDQDRRKAEQRAKISKERDAIWQQIGGRRDMSAATKAEKREYDLLFYIVSGWYGVSARVDDLRNLATQAGAGANLAYNTNQVLLRFIAEQQIAQYRVMQTLSDQISEIAESDADIPGWAIRLTHTLRNAFHPASWGYATMEDVTEAYKQTGETLFNEQQSTPDDYEKRDLHEHVRTLTQTHQDRFSGTIQDAARERADKDSGRRG